VSKARLDVRVAAGFSFLRGFPAVVPAIVRHQFFAE
jgi:hypothetical protein